MIAFLGKLFASLLSSIIFFSVFAIAGDVLIAAVVATACAAAQFAVATTARPGGMTWASLAVVLAVTGTTLAGVDVTDSALASRQIVTPVNDTCPVPHSTI